MIIVMRPDATDDDMSGLLDLLTTHGAEPRLTNDTGRRVLITSSGIEALLTLDIAALDGVERVVGGDAPLRLVSREFRPENSIVRVGDLSFGDGSFVVVAGPCAVESRDQMMAAGRSVGAGGARMLRGDAFKPRTSPYAFQGLGEPALKILSDVRDVTGLPFVAEVLDPRDVDLVASYADMLRIGTRNMSNVGLLREVGRQTRPVQLKRGHTATIEEWLDAAEYIYSEGNARIILVERGIRTFESSVRNTLDISAVPILKALTHLPVMVDPSHASGRRDLVAPLSRAAMAAGADGLMIDVHPYPDQALVDGGQALDPVAFAGLMDELRDLAAALGRGM
jgi:3-deoxy-7-phosphoheptulonate synthase